MKIIANFTNENFIDFFEFNFVVKNKCVFYIQTWEGGYGFLDVCNEDGGISDYHSELFIQKNLVSETNDKKNSLI